MATFKFSVRTTQKEDKTFANVTIAGKTIPSNLIITGKIAKKLVKEENNIKETDIFRLRGSVYEKEGQTRKSVWLNSLDRTQSYLIKRQDEFTYNEIKELLDLVDEYWNRVRQQKEQKSE